MRSQDELDALNKARREKAIVYYYYIIRIVIYHNMNFQH